MDGQVREMFQVDLGLDDEKATTSRRRRNEADEHSAVLGFGEKATSTRAMGWAMAV